MFRTSSSRCSGFRISRFRISHYELSSFETTTAELRMFGFKDLNLQLPSFLFRIVKFSIFRSPSFQFPNLDVRLVEVQFPSFRCPGYLLELQFNLYLQVTFLRFSFKVPLYATCFALLFCVTFSGNVLVIYYLFKSYLAYITFVSYLLSDTFFGLPFHVTFTFNV